MPQLENMCFDLWIAGMETTANTLAWAALYALHHPEIQVYLHQPYLFFAKEKIHSELDEKIGSNRIIDNSDRNKLHYLNAFICVC